jgi:hypothetical protein
MIEIEIYMVDNAVDAGHVFLPQVLAAFFVGSHSIILSKNQRIRAELEL